MIRAVVLILALAPSIASAQELEPGAYWPLPVGLNILTAVNSVNWGDLSFEPSVPVEAASARINTTAAAFTRALSIAGRSANAGIQVPIVGGHVEGLYLGSFTEVGRFGQGDPRFRLAVNLYGAPAMDPKGFVAYPLRTIVGASRVVVPPLGKYDNTKVINLGTHRWSIKRNWGWRIGPWVLELMAGVVFTDNTTSWATSRTASGRRRFACLPLRPVQHVAGRRRQLLQGDRRPSTARRTWISAQLAHRRYLLVDDHPPPLIAPP